jgi:hypothetical protein
MVHYTIEFIIIKVVLKRSDLLSISVKDHGNTLEDPVTWMLHSL